LVFHIKIYWIAVDIATCYALDSQGFISRWGSRFSAPILLDDGYQVSFPGVKWVGCGINYPPPSSAEIKEMVELYLIFPSSPSWPVIE
jgi:hypothetical protein